MHVLRATNSCQRSNPCAPSTQVKSSGTVGDLGGLKENKSPFFTDDIHGSYDVLRTSTKHDTDTSPVTSVNSSTFIFISIAVISTFSRYSLTPAISSFPSLSLQFILKSIQKRKPEKTQRYDKFEKKMICGINWRQRLQCLSIGLIHQNS